MIAKKNRAILVVGVLLGLLSCSGDEAPDGVVETPPIDAPPSPPIVSDGDEPTISESVANAARELQRSDGEGLKLESHSDGSVSVDLKGQYRSATVVMRDKNGRFIMTHGDVHSQQEEENDDQ